MKYRHIVSKGTFAAVMAAAASLLFPPAGHSAEQPPNLIVIGKTVNYRQSEDGGLTLLNYHFFAEVFQPPNLKGGGAGLVGPHGDTISFHTDGSILNAGSDHEYRSLDDLNAHMPNGAYTVHYTQPGAPLLTATVQLHATEAVMAAPVRLRLLQDGREAAPSAIDPARTLVIQWSPFAKGHADPRGISDDLIFVHVGDCRGRVIARTPAPFSGEAALTFRSKSYAVPENTLEHGSVYQISVEQAPLATSRNAGVPTLATYPAITFLDIKTTGAGGASCPNPPYRMDHGQSDRQRAPAAAVDTAGAPPAKPSDVRITGQVTFLYYKDLTAPRKFYGEVLGLAPYFETEWVTLYRTVAATTIGLVKEPDSDTGAKTKRSVVMVSLVTDDVDGWYRKLRHNPGVHVVKALYDHPAVPIRAFEVEDPAGYPVEFFQWIDPASAKSPQPK